jgi:Fe-S-cluster containining protein
VRVRDGEIVALARRVGLPEVAFRAIYTRRLRGGEVSLREKRSKQCVFFDGARGCAVYPDRPRQCRTWPFWRSVVHSRERWAEEAEECPGMGSGPLHQAEWIERATGSDGTSGLPRPAERVQPLLRKRR